MKNSKKKPLNKIATSYAPHSLRGEFIVGEGTRIKTKNIDRSGNIKIGKYCIISTGVKILRHSHQFMHKQSQMITRAHPVCVYPLDIGNNVFIGENAIITSSVSKIPSGCVIGVGSVLTKNPTGRYQLWAGNPARYIRTLEK